MDKTVYISNMPRDISTKKLSDTFMRYGTIKSVRIKYTYAFVEFMNERSADEVMRDAKILFKKTRLIVKKAKTMKFNKYRDKRHSPYRVIVKNLSNRATWRDLKYYMMKAGGVVVFADVTKLHEGYVEYETKEQMEKAFNELNNTNFKGLDLKLLIDYHPDEKDLATK